MPDDPTAPPLPAARPQSARNCWRFTLPRLCEVCHGWSATTLCTDCRARYAAPRMRCPRCALPTLASTPGCGECLAAAPPWDRCFTAVDYAFPWDRVIGRLKFGRRPDLAAPLATMLAATIESAPGGYTPVDVVVPVPLGPDRLASRGFNQSWQIARALAPRLGLKADAALLLRCRDTAPQVGLDRRAREANLRQALLAAPDRVDAITGRGIAIVDDVMTTGATAAAAALALRAAGAATIMVWVVARADRPDRA